MAKKTQSYRQGAQPLTQSASNIEQWRQGHLYLLDKLPHGDPAIGGALFTYANYIDTGRQSRQWLRALGWIENILFSAGRHYISDILASRLAVDSSENLSIVQEAQQTIPKPVNDLLGRFVETNIALLTENRPIPRVTPKSGKAEDEDAAELSELTLEYLWEALKMPEKHREIARLILHCGVCFMEVTWDPTMPRRMKVPQTEPTTTSPMIGPDGRMVELPVAGTQLKFDEQGKPIYTDTTEYGDIVANIVSPFEIHLPVCHWWNGQDMQWIMKESYLPKSLLIDQFSTAKKMGLTKKDGWFMDNLDKIGTTNVKNLPLWWWERISEIVEGPGPSLYVGAPEQWEGYTVVRTFDRKPNALWPKGRTIIVAGEQVLYDSPKDVGARAYNPRWPERWHPYIRFRWEGMPGTSIWGRSLVSKLLPKLKRINSIDTTAIMYRRTVPIAAWIAPKGSQPIEDLWNGMPGLILQYDPRRTDGKAPEPVFPASFPESIINERETQMAEMEAIAGTEEILRGQRPTGVNSAAMIDILRKQALASRSAILQAWDEALQEEGTALLQEVATHIKQDPRYAERIRILARENHSSITVDNFSGADLSDNVIVRVDTASMALVSKEARQAKVLEFIQYLGAGGLMSLPLGLRQNILDELGFPNSLNPSGPDVDRAKRMLAFIRQKQYQRAVPMMEDDPYVFYELLLKEVKADSFYNYDVEQAQYILQLMASYKMMIEQREAQILKMQMMQAQMGQKPGGGGQQGGPPQQ